jgi:hypothetical protein
MQHTTLEKRDVATEWVATCPKASCRTKYSPEQIKCPNCGHRLLFFRELHSQTNIDASGYNVTKKWFECGFECENDHIKLKSFLCERDNVLITVSCVSAYLRNPSPGCLKFILGFLAFIFSLGMTGALLQNAGMGNNVAMVFSYVVAITVTVFAVKALTSKKWYSYEN